MRIIKPNDDEWSHSSDDGSGYSNASHFQNKKNMNENKIIDYILGLFTKNGYAKYVRNRKFWQYIDKANKVSTLVKFLYGAGGFIAGWLAKALANVLGM